VRGAVSGVLRCDPASPEWVVVLVEVVAAVGEEPGWRVMWPPAQILEVGIASSGGVGWATSREVSTGQREGQGGVVSVGDQVVFAGRTCMVDWRRSGVSPPLRAQS
jgi:hypothetical protein